MSNITPPTQTVKRDWPEFWSKIKPLDPDGDGIEVGFMTVPKKATVPAVPGGRPKHTYWRHLTYIKAEGIEWEDHEENGRPSGRSQRNIGIFLDAAGVELGFNKFTSQIVVKSPTGAWELADDTIVNGIYMLMHRSSFEPAKGFLLDALLDLARHRSFHPVLDYLDSLKWDGKPRLDTWLPRYCGADDTPLNRAFGAKHLMACVARVQRPGCHKDEMLTLQGPQGCGKSSTPRLLAGEEWFNDSIKAGMDAKLVIELMEGSWIGEMSELDGMNNAQNSKVKAMLASRTDKARLAYARLPTIRPRQFVLFGSTNDTVFLRDDTGNRRFWPVKVGLHDVGAGPNPHGGFMFDLAGLERDRDQLWAEAKYRLWKGEDYRLPPDLYAEAGRVQDSATIVHPWEDRLEVALDGFQGNIDIDSLWSYLGIQGDRQNKYLASVINTTMQRLGYTKEKRRRAKKPTPCYSNADNGKWFVFPDLS